LRGELCNDDLALHVDPEVLAKCPGPSELPIGIQHNAQARTLCQNPT
jgi:hypothetical protein